MRSRPIERSGGREGLENSAGPLRGRQRERERERASHPAAPPPLHCRSRPRSSSVVASGMQERIGSSISLLHRFRGAYIDIDRGVPKIKRGISLEKGLFNFREHDHQRRHDAQFGCNLTQLNQVTFDGIVHMGIKYIGKWQGNLTGV